MEQNRLSETLDAARFVAVVGSEVALLWLGGAVMIIGIAIELAVSGPLQSVRRSRKVRAAVREPVRLGYAPRSHARAA